MVSVRLQLLVHSKFLTLHYSRKKPSAFMLCTPHHAPFPLCHTADTLELSVFVQTDETNCHLFDLAGSTLPCMLHTVCYTNTCTHAVTHMFCVKITASLHDCDT